jgi:circadian clock protein KaiC
MQPMKLLHTGVPNLDTVLGGGVPAYSLNIVAGQPGTGKTIFIQQMLFDYIKANDGARVLYMTTLSEPTLKVVRYMQRFNFFDAEAFGEQVIYQDIGSIIREQTLPQVTDHILEQVHNLEAQILVIDSFKAIRDLGVDTDEFRRYCYDLSVRLASARCTAFLVGEYDEDEIAHGAEFAVADGIMYMAIARQQGEQYRYLQVYKMRGQKAQMSPFPFVISDDGARILSPALTLRRRESGLEVEDEQLGTGIDGLDALLQNGIRRGYSVILSGASGTGKTSLALRFLVYGAQQGQKGLLVSFEESPDRLHRMAERFNWNVKELEAQGLLKIVFVPQTDIRVEENLEQMVQTVAEFQPVRFVVDSFSVFLHKEKDPAMQREKTFQLATLAQQAGMVGLLISDIPAGEPHRISRFGVEETVVDGAIVLSTEIQNLTRRRFIEVYKMRSANHIAGRHRMEITGRGVEVFYATQPDLSKLGTPGTLIAPEPLSFEPINKIVHSELPFGASWLVRGDPGLGKSTLAYQFAIEGLRRREGVLFIAADAPAYQVSQSLQDFGFLPDPYLETGQLTLLDAYQRQTGMLDLSDPEAFLFAVIHQMEQMPKPLRLVFDSLTPLALNYTPAEFVALIHRKNRLLSRPDVTVFDTVIQQMLPESQLYSLLNTFDVVLDLYSPSWGEMGLAGNRGYRALRVYKVRGAHADSRPFPYTITPSEGIVVQKDYYQGQMGQ